MVKDVCLARIYIEKQWKKQQNGMKCVLCERPLTGVSNQLSLNTQHALNCKWPGSKPAKIPDTSKSCTAGWLPLWDDTISNRQPTTRKKWTRVGRFIKAAPLTKDDPKQQQIRFHFGLSVLSALSQTFTHIICCRFNVLAEDYYVKHYIIQFRASQKTKIVQHCIHAVLVGDGCLPPAIQVFLPRAKVSKYPANSSSF